jgi:hypothetical protein
MTFKFQRSISKLFVLYLDSVRVLIRQKGRFPENTLKKLMMADDLIPGDVKQFILDKIDSVAELEGFLQKSRNPETE